MFKLYRKKYIHGANGTTPLKIRPMSKQTSAGHWTKFKAFLALSDYKGHVDLSVKCLKERTVCGARVLAPFSTDAGSKATGDQDPHAPHHPLHGERPLHLCAGAPDPYPQGHCYYLGLFPQEAAEDDWYGRPEAALSPWTTLPRTPFMPFPRSTAISPKHL